MRAPLYLAGFFISLLIASICIAEQLEPSTISYIYTNREHLAKNYCFGNSFGVKKSILETYMNDSLKVWQAHEVEIVSSLIPAYFPKNCEELRKRIGSIRDSVSLLVLVSVLDLKDPRPPRRQFGNVKNLDAVNWVSSAIDWLVNAGSVPMLNQHSDLIFQKMTNCKQPDFQKAQLLSLISLTDTLKKEAITMANSDQTADANPEKMAAKLWTLARLGDIKAEKKLIEMFTSASTFDGKMKLIDPVSLAGSQDCIKTLLATFDRKIVNQNDPVKSYFRGYCLSLRGNIIIALARHFPDIDLFTEERLLFYKIKNYDCDTDLQKKYIEDFTLWSKKSHGIEINYTFQNSGPLISGGCTETFAKQFREECQ